MGTWPITDVRARWLALLFALAFAAPAQAAPSLVSLGTFATPTYAAAPASEPSRVFVTEKAGRVRLIVDGVVQTAPFLDLTAKTRSSDSERGLLSIAFAPDYATSGKFYVYLTAVSPLGEIQVWEYQRSAADPNLADPASGRLLIGIPHTDAANHNGGTVAIGPDGKVWLATGDGGGSDNQYGHSQDDGSRLGKLLRLDPAAPANVEQLARGLRNPFRFSFAPDGTIIIADVGQGAWEEIDVGLAANYGWPCREGANAYHSDPGCDGVATADPVVQKSHSPDGFCAIVGGVMVRDAGLPSLAGRYLYGDNCNSALRSVNLAAPASDAPAGLTVGGLAGIGEDACGRVLVVSLAGPVSRITDGASTPCATVTPTPTPTATATATPTATADSDSDAHGDRNGDADRHGRTHRHRRAHRNGRAHGHRHPRGDDDAVLRARTGRLPPDRRAALRGLDARHRPQLPRPPPLSGRRPAHRRGLPGDDQRQGLSQRQRAARARHPPRGQAAAHDEPRSYRGGPRRGQGRRRQRPPAQPERAGQPLVGLDAADHPVAERVDEAAVVLARQPAVVRAPRGQVRGELVLAIADHRADLGLDVDVHQRVLVADV